MILDELNRKFIIDIDNGIIISKHTKKPIVATNGKGYLMLRVFKKIIPAHIAIYFYANNKYPNGIIDHIDHNKTNNSISNLRVTTVSGNNSNKSLYKNSSSKTHGVRFVKHRNRWVSRIKVNNKSIFLGSFETEKEAIKARFHAEKIYKFHNNHGC